MKNNKERFESIATKIDPAMAEVLNACCDALQVDVYHLLQWFAYTIIRAAAPKHELDPRIQKLLTLLECDAGWQKAFNIANPDDLKVAQVVLILEQKDHKGFGAVMIDKPFMGAAMRQTECVDTILERVCEVTMRGIYRQLRDMGGDLGCQNLSDILLSMIDEQNRLNAQTDIYTNGPLYGSHTASGKEYADGKKTKAKQRKTPDTLASDRRYKETQINFEEWEGQYQDKGEE
jgi:hypothetical protein